MMTKGITTTFGALLLAGLLGACGDDGGSGSGNQNSGDEAGRQLYDWVDCMRGEGIDIPDPSRDANGDLVITGNGFDMGPPKFGQETESSFGEYSPDEMGTASRECGFPPFLGAGVASDETIREEQDNMLAFAECMREQGIDFADPDFSSEESPMPPLDESDPDALAAAETCNDRITASAAAEDSD